MLVKVQWSIGFGRNNVERFFKLYPHLSSFSCGESSLVGGGWIALKIDFSDPRITQSSFYAISIIAQKLEAAGAVGSKYEKIFVEIEPHDSRDDLIKIVQSLSLRMNEQEKAMRFAIGVMKKSRQKLASKELQEARMGLELLL